MSTTELAAMILTTGLDDWVPLAAIEGFALREGVPSDDVMSVVLSTIEGLATAELVEIGEVSEGGFSEWQGTIDSQLGRIRQLWREDDPEVRRFRVWLSNTPAGDAAAGRA